jgi:hypothetical protein
LPLAVQRTLSQDSPFIVLDSADAEGVTLAAKQKREADLHWRAVERFVRDKYTTATGHAEAGDKSLEVKSTRKGWEGGFDFAVNCLEYSQDCNIIVARPKAGCEAKTETETEN